MIFSQMIDLTEPQKALPEVKKLFQCNLSHFYFSLWHDIPRVLNERLVSIIIDWLDADPDRNLTRLWIEFIKELVKGIEKPVELNMMSEHEFGLFESYMSSFVWNGINHPATILDIMQNNY